MNIKFSFINDFTERKRDKINNLSYNTLSPFFKIVHKQTSLSVSSTLGALFRRGGSNPGNSAMQTSCKTADLHSYQLTIKNHVNINS
jgi:hypothetical protein